MQSVFSDGFAYWTAGGVVVDKRKVKIGGKDKREAANARVDTFLENIVPTKIPELNKKREKIGIKMKRGVKAQEQRRIDQVD